ncbi:hypothetical protein PSH97_08880 [Pseudomonas cucumis]|uniref:Uncharacterized protein n=1 Tax=Pseudomonas cucumis TaxID=2954082 RepID=A0ABY9F3B4_9PSED|nr:hypothetical protein [Pseudomonas cucumis]WLG86616.1 hypothetical protein PSH97_08880 [Pseudomonas cucumis]
MNASSIFILTYDPDPTVNKSAQGLFFKYLMHQNIKKIIVAEIQADFNKLIIRHEACRDDDNQDWKISSKGTWKLISKQDKHEVDVEITDKERESITNIINTKKNKSYKKTRDCGAIIACHGTSSTIAHMQPESFALGLLKLSNTEDSNMPFFDKIVFNVCKFAKTNTNTPPDFWEAYKPDKQAYTAFRFVENDVLKIKDIAHSELDDPKERFLNCVFRFLNVYGPKAGKEEVLAAGYTEGLTAMHPLKADIKNKTQNDMNTYNTMEYAGIKVSAENDQPMSLMRRRYKRAFSYRLGKGVMVVDNIDSEWSDIQV